MLKLNHTQKQQVLEAIRLGCTLKAGAIAIGIDISILKAEIKRSSVFKKRIHEALEDGKLSAGDDSIQYLIDVRDGKFEKTDRNRVTAAIALANWGKPGFRGATTVQGRIEHDVRVITAVPRPKYVEVETPKVKVLESGRTVEDQKKFDEVEKKKLEAIMWDKPTNKIGAVEQVIEGEVLNETETNQVAT